MTGKLEKFFLIRQGFFDDGIKLVQLAADEVGIPIVSTGRGFCRFAATLQQQEFMRNIERRHDGDAFVADHLAGVADFAHFFVEVLHRGRQLPLFAAGGGDAKFAAHHIDGDAFGVLRFFGFAHARSLSDSGNCAIRVSMRVFA